MKKFLNLTCSVCRRSIDQTVNNTHYTTDKCTITYGCTGRLLPVVYRSNRDVQITPAVGVEDWRPRGTTQIEYAAPENEVLIDLSTGTRNTLVLAIQVTQSVFNAQELIVELNSQNSEHRRFKQFTYSFLSSFSIISGVEGGVEKKVLRYTADDVVEVFVNGVEMERGPDPDQFMLHDGTPKSAVGANTVRFNSDINLSGTTQVSIIVNKPVKADIYTLKMQKHRAQSGKIGAWDNVKFCQFFNSTSTEYREQGYRDYYLFSCDINANSLPLNNIFTVKRVATSIAECEVDVDLAQCHFLLARKPFTFLDRYLTLSVPLDGLSIERDYLKFTTISKKPVLQVTQTAIVPCYPPIKIPFEAKFKPEVTVKSSAPGDPHAIVIDGAVIIGPDT